jgi:hypothetical protein
MHECSEVVISELHGANVPGSGMVQPQQPSATGLRARFFELVRHAGTPTARRLLLHALLPTCSTSCAYARLIGVSLA